MDRVRTLFVLAPLLVLLACDAPTTAPVIDSEPGTTGIPESLQVSGDDLGGPFGPFPEVYPFNPYPDGFQFKNFGGAADWELYDDIFGGKVHPWSILDVTFYTDTFVHLFGGGQCYGFAVAAGMFYRGLFGPHPSYFQRGATIPWEIPQFTRGGGDLALDEDIERYISKYWYFWYSETVRKARTRRLSAANAGVIVDLVEAEFTAGWHDPWILEFYGPWGGHAVNIVDLDRTETGATFTIYDNNAPFKPDADPGLRDFLWSPDGFTYGSRQVDVIAIAPVSPHEVDSMEKWWGDPNFDDLYIWVSRILDPELFVVHTDIFGSRLGRTASTVFDEIDGAEEVIVPTGVVNEDWVPPVQYYLPPGDYTVDLLSPTTGDIAYQLFAGDAMFSVATLGTGPSTGRVSNLLDGNAFAFETQDPVAGLQARLVQVLSGAEERAIDVSGLLLREGGSLRIMPTADANGFNVAFGGAEAALCDLSLTEASPAGAISQVLPGVQLLDGASLVLEPWDWGRLTEMPVFVRTSMPDASVFLQAYNATAMNLGELLDDMVESGAIPNRGIANSIRKQVERAPIRALMNHLESLVAEGKIAVETADLILATAEAAAAGGTSSGRYVR